VSSDVQASISLLVGIVTLRLSLSRLYLNFVRPAMRPWLIAAGAALVVFGAVAFLRAIRPSPPHEDEEHDHHHHVPLASWLLILPALVLLLVAPNPLGSFAAARSSNTLADTTSDYRPLPKPTNGAVDVTLSDFVGRALYDKNRSLQGTQVRLIGFASPALSQGADFDLTRFVITCCAADARSVQVAVFGTRAPPTDSWVEIVGTLRKPGKSFDPLVDAPGIDVKTITPIRQPEVPYEQ
jgi:uncharacterized repeat protein (TIGR03943 family)